MDLSTSCASWAHILLIETESIPTVSEVKLANGKVKQVPAALKIQGKVDSYHTTCPNWLKFS